jgi:hypothetical protein
MRLQILSDGTSFGTRVRDSETGEEIDNIRSVTFHAQACELPYATIEVYDPDVDADVEASEDDPITAHCLKVKATDAMKNTTLLIHAKVTNRWQVHLGVGLIKIGAWFAGFAGTKFNDPDDL